MLTTSQVRMCKRESMGGGAEKVGKLFKVDDAMAHNHRVAHHTLSLVGQPKQNMSINFSNT